MLGLLGTLGSVDGLGSMGGLLLLCSSILLKRLEYHGVVPLS